jgi:AAHS family 4-hydroxybenzoate transporter-like MFS transporter
VSQPARKVQVRAATRIDVAGLIDSQPVSGFQWGVFVTAMAVATLDGYDLQSMALAAPSIAQQWGVEPKSFGPVFTATPVGMVFGALLLGPIADRWGRKIPTIIAIALFGLFTLLTPFATSIGTMAVFRFMMGLGTGGILPNLIALVSEYAPQRRRASLTTLTFSAIPFGSMLGGLVASWLIPTHGWQWVFYVGGVIPLLVAAWCVIRLPESIRFLASRGDSNERILTTLRKIGITDLSREAEFYVPDVSTGKVSLSRLFGPGRTAPTLLITLVLALNTFMLYFLLSWLPTVMNLAGLSTRGSLLATVLPNLGGVVGAIMLGRFIDRYDGFRVMAVGGLIAGTAVMIVGLGHSSSVVLIPTLFFAGTCIMGGQPAIYVLLAALYPTSIRATGAGFALGAGRFGSIIGPVAGAWVLAAGWSVQEIFAMAAAPGFVVALALWIISRIPRDFR